MLGPNIQGFHTVRRFPGLDARRPPLPFHRRSGALLSPIAMTDLESDLSETTSLSRTSSHSPFLPPDSPTMLPSLSTSHRMGLPTIQRRSTPLPKIRLTLFSLVALESDELDSDLETISVLARRNGGHFLLPPDSPSMLPSLSTSHRTGLPTLQGRFPGPEASTSPLPLPKRRLTFLSPVTLESDQSDTETSAMRSNAPSLLPLVSIITSTSKIPPSTLRQTRILVPGASWENVVRRIRTLEEKERRQKIEKRKQIFDLTAKIPELVKRSTSLAHKFNIIKGMDNIIEMSIGSISKVNSIASWTEAEVEVFVTEFLKKPKDFESISAFLEGKSRGDCIKFYYLKKKDLFKKTRVGKKFVRKVKKGMKGGLKAMKD